MKSIFEEYRQKLTTAEEAVKCVKSGDWVDYTMAHGIPVMLDKALAKRKNELSDIKVRGCMTLRPLAILEVDPQKEVFTYHSWHFSRYDREMSDKGLCYYIPLVYRNEPIHYKRTIDVDVAMISVTSMDKHGYFGFSLNNSTSKAILDNASVVIVEVNNNLPKVFGLCSDCVHVSEVDYIVEGENGPLPIIEEQREDAVSKQIARFIIDDIRDGSVLQLGVGRLPNAIGKYIAESDIADLGVHTEMLSDAYYTIFRNGKLTNRRNVINPGVGVWSFALGSQDLYEWVEENPGFRSAPIDYTNSPYVMSKIPRFVSINSCLKIDLFGQICAESAGVRQISGTGGQLDFLTGAYRSEGGKAYICLNSTYLDTKSGELKSCITSSLSSGEIVTDPRSQVCYVVTEFGKVNLAGCSTWERAEKLISIANPKFQQQLERQAHEMGILR